MSAIINLHGNLVPPDEARISALDHGFLFGDSIYETLRTHARVPFLMDRHLDRCWRSAQGLGLSIPWERERLEEEILRSLEAADNADSLVRIVVTRGAGETLDMQPISAHEPLVVLYVFPHPTYPLDFYERGVRVAVVDTRRSPTAGVDPTLKTGSRLGNVLALAEARRRDAFEAVMRNEAGQLTEGTTSNIFLGTGDALRTAPVEAGLLPGITRQVVMELARAEGIAVEERRLEMAAIEGAEEAFLTSTTKGVMPVRTIDGCDLGAPGPLTRRLMEAFARRVEEERERGLRD